MKKSHKFRSSIFDENNCTYEFVGFCHNDSQQATFERMLYSLVNFLMQKPSEFTRVAVNCRCKIDTQTDIDIDSPLVLTTTGDYIYPQPGQTSFLYFNPNDLLLLVCSERKKLAELMIFNHKFADGNVTVQCLDNSTFFINSPKFSFNFQNVHCKQSFKSSVVQIKQPTSCTGKNLIHYATGFLLPLIENTISYVYVVNICYDKKHNHPLYTNHVIRPNSKFKQTNQNLTFKFDDFLFDVPQYYAYVRNNQLSTFLKLLGKAATNYLVFEDNLIQNTDKVLEKGHLAPRGDFFYYSEQEATYYYINVVPMWKSINQGNWNQLEKSVRRLSANKKKVLQVWTGAWGMLELANESKKLKKIKLEMPKNPTKSIPVPKYLYKIIYDEQIKRAVVVIVINDPYNDPPLDTLNEICTDVKYKISWLYQAFTSKNKGFIWVCEYIPFIRYARLPLQHLFVQDLLA